jgi:IrrE N-terminal-like domain
VPEPSFTRRRLEAIVEGALRSAGVLGVLPTPLEALREVAGIRGVEPMDRLPHDLVPQSRPLLGALWFAERTMYVDGRQSLPRRRFTEAHELMHALCPWHESVLRLDTEDELFRPVRATIEAEANAGAGLLIFQGREFARRAGTEPPSIERALELAAEHGASAHATLHHLAETHRSAAALLTVGRFRQRGGGLPVWRTAESRSFLTMFGRARERIAPALRPGTALHELAEAARGAGRAGAAIRLVDRAGRTRRCKAESYYNRHAFLVLITADVR